MYYSNYLLIKCYIKCLQTGDRFFGKGGRQCYAVQILAARCEGRNMSPRLVRSISFHVDFTQLPKNLDFI